eukprot:12008096-Heterocapsa_arctica.AAC.1
MASSSSSMWTPIAMTLHARPTTMMVDFANDQTQATPSGAPQSGSGLGRRARMVNEKKQCFYVAL